MRDFILHGLPYNSGVLAMNTDCFNDYYWFGMGLFSCVFHYNAPFARLIRPDAVRATP